MSIQTWSVPFEAYCGTDPYIFISYSHRDHLEVFEDINYLHRSGYRIWFDEGIDPGNEWTEMVEKYLLKCAFFIVFISDGAVESDNVRDEINLAIRRKKPFIAIHLHETELKRGLDLIMGTKQAIMKYRSTEAMYHNKLEKVLSGSELSYLTDGVTPNLKFAESKDSKSPVPLVFDAGMSDRIDQYQRDSNWAKIAEIGPQYAEFLIRNNGHDNTSIFNTVLKLINLSVILTDADCHVSAKETMDSTVEILLKLIHEDRENIQYLDHLGMVYNNQGRQARKINSKSRSAESFYRKSAEIFAKLYPNLSDNKNLGDRLGMAYQNLGNALKAQVRMKEALDVYEQAVKAYERVLIDYPDDKRIRSKLQESKQMCDSVKDEE